MVKIHSLHIRRLKGGKAESVECAYLGPTGLIGDHQWCVVKDGTFVTQRGHRTKTNTSGSGIGIPAICQVTTTEHYSYHIKFSAPGMQSFMLPLAGQPGTEIPFEIWGKACLGVDQGDDAAKWFRKFLGPEAEGCRLVYESANHRRADKYHESSRVAFQDGSQLLVTSTASHEFLSAHVVMDGGEAVSSDSVRSNIVLEGGKDAGPHFEDSVGLMVVNNHAIMTTTACIRCKVPGLDQKTGQMRPEILRALAKYRKALNPEKQAESVILYGMNAVGVTRGSIRVGDEVQIFTTRDMPTLL